jgi:hypothetical protein
LKHVKIARFPRINCLIFFRFQVIGQRREGSGIEEINFSPEVKRREN